jgi:hypothetical protein
MKTKKGQKGFVLLLVLAIISLFTAEMYMLSEDSFSLMFQTNDCFLDAVEKNLVLSGLAWSRENISNDGSKIYDKNIELNLPADFPKDSELNVFIKESPANPVEVNIDASCKIVKQTRKKQKLFIID